MKVSPTEKKIPAILFTPPYTYKKNLALLEIPTPLHFSNGPSLSVDTRQKKHVLIGCQTWRVLPPNISLTAVKANCRAKGKLFICFWSPLSSSYLISFLNFQAYFSLRNSTLASRDYSYRLKILAKNTLLSENKSTRQQLPSSNFECLAAKHRTCLRPSRKCFFPHVYTLRCNRL